MIAFTRIQCGECGGEYVTQDNPSIGFYECIGCGHVVSSHDLVLDEGETETVNAFGVLGYITGEVSA